MRVGGHILFVLASAVIAGEGWVASPLQPSDIELTAVYCIGVLKNRLAMLQEHSQPFTNLTDALRSDLERLGHFIGPRVGHLDTTHLAIARRRANDDFMSWHVEAAECMQRCTNGGKSNSNTQRACWMTCSQTGAPFERMRICSSLSWLPP